MVEIGNSDNCPLARGTRRPLKIVTSRRGESVHCPNRDLSKRGIVPDNVTSSQAVEVSNSDDRPAQVNDCHPSTGFNGFAIHEPDPGVARESISPQDIFFAVPIEIRGVRNRADWTSPVWRKT